MIKRIPPTIQTPKFLAFVQSTWIDGLFSGEVGCPTSGINSAYFEKALLIKKISYIFQGIQIKHYFIKTKHLNYANGTIDCVRDV